MDKRAINNKRADYIARMESTVKGRIAIWQACWDPMPRFLPRAANGVIPGYEPPPLGIVEVWDEEIVQSQGEEQAFVGRDNNADKCTKAGHNCQGSVNSRKQDGPGSRDDVTAQETTA